jgi:hypothetical protein
MTRKWIVINSMMLVVAALLGWQIYVSARQYSRQNNVANLARVQPAKKKSVLDPALPPLKSLQKVNDGDYLVVAEQNLFSESRKLPEQTDNTPAPEPVRKLDINPVLVGVMLSGSQRVAMISDPAAGNSPNARRYQTMRVGDYYRGFMVTDITATNMVLESGPSREIIPLWDTSKPPQSGKTPILATRVVNFGPGSATAGAAPAAAPVAAAAGARPAQQPASTAPARGQSNSTAGRGIPGGQRSGAPVVGVAGGGTQGPTWNSTIDAQGRVQVLSPFGTFTLQQQQQQQQQTPVKKK